MNDLKEIKQYWTKKYPQIFISLWSNQDGDKYYGIMKSSSDSLNLSADTLGQLIAQGESFLRQIKR